MRASSIGLHGHTETFGVVRVTLEPPLIGANETYTQVIMAPRVQVGDFVVAPSLATFSGTCLVGAFVINEGELELTWLNTDNQSVTPAPGPALIFFLRGPVVDATDTTPVPQVHRREHADDREAPHPQ